MRAVTVSQERMGSSAKRYSVRQHPPKEKEREKRDDGYLSFFSHALLCLSSCEIWSFEYLNTAPSVTALGAMHVARVVEVTRLIYFLLKKTNRFPHHRSLSSTVH